MSDRLCFVEDDPTIRELVAAKLEAHGYEVERHESAEAVMRQLSEERFADLYILDVLLRGKGTGISLCRALKSKKPTVPVLILSALSEPTDRIEGLRSGADDYLAKPFEMEELLLRINGMLKRRSWYGNLPENQSVFEWDGRSVDFLSYVATHGKERFSMTQKECMLMKLLIEKEGQVVSRDEVLDRVWGYDVYPSTRTVDNFILRLRRYFEDEPRAPKYIHSIRGLGYKFTSRTNSEQGTS